MVFSLCETYVPPLWSPHSSTLAKGDLLGKVKIVYMHVSFQAKQVRPASTALVECNLVFDFDTVVKYGSLQAIEKSIGDLTREQGILPASVP